MIRDGVCVDHFPQACPVYSLPIRFEPDEIKRYIATHPIPQSWFDEADNPFEADEPEYEI